MRNVQKPIGVGAGKLEVVTYVGSGSKKVTDDLNRLVGMIDRKIEQLVMAPLAAGIGVLTEEEMAAGVVVIDMGASTTGVAVFSNGSLAYAASFAVGSGHVTNDIAALLKTSPADAERLKVRQASAYAADVSEEDTVDVLQLDSEHTRPLQRKVLSEIVESRMREIAKMARKHVGSASVASVVLTGGGSRIPGSDVVFKESFPGFPVRVAEMDVSPYVATCPGAAVSIGLSRFALQCYDDLMPASGTGVWRDRVRSLFSMISGR